MHTIRQGTTHWTVQFVDPSSGDRNWVCSFTSPFDAMGMASWLNGGNFPAFTAQGHRDFSQIGKLEVMED